MFPSAVYLICSINSIRASLAAQIVENLPAVQETWVWSPGWEDPLEKGMATHSSILAWRIPWTEKPGGLQSMGSQRIRHDWATNTHAHTHTNSIYVSIPISQFHMYVLMYDICFSLSDLRGFSDSSVGKESSCNAGDPSSIPGLGRSAGEGKGYPLQYSWASFMAQLVKNPPVTHSSILT